jgi:hypothetical protein
MSLINGGTFSGMTSNRAAQYRPGHGLKKMAQSIEAKQM